MAVASHLGPQLTGSAMPQIQPQKSATDQPVSFRPAWILNWELISCHLSS